jgi:hypothetical protein
MQYKTSTRWHDLFHPKTAAFAAITDDNVESHFYPINTSIALIQCILRHKHSGTLRFSTQRQLQRKQKTPAGVKSPSATRSDISEVPIFYLLKSSYNYNPPEFW